ncbi:CFI-box-CTERM domain-containing protein [uncultured Nostoc sp.]|uniref:CFI-box-CTERM domain-containing protein n=1 Tax=uncultured Nostoc sp. TaxID=340711 RepID=UPI0035CAB571
MSKHNCPKCRKEIRYNAEYCSHCGCNIKAYYASLEVKYRCKKCGTSFIFKPGSNYCDKCGNPLKYNKDKQSSVNLGSHTTSRASSSKGDCFIVTACDADEDILHSFYVFRDNILLTSSTGKTIIKFYYRYSPGIANVIRRSKLLKILILFLLVKPIEFVLRTFVISNAL